MRGTFADQAKRLRAIRIACGYKKQTAWANALELSKGHWNEFENGKRELTLEVARKMKVGWGIPLDFSLDGDLAALDMAPSGLVKKLEAAAA